VIRFLPRAAAPLLLLAVWVAIPAAASAHPLGNFTINHYAGIRVAPDGIALDVVIDTAEIPTFQERQRIDADGDGQVSDEEIEAERHVACARLAGSLKLTAASRVLPLDVRAAGLTFLPGAAGLQTMRLTCEYEAALAAPLAAGSSVSFADESSPGRIGWREIVVAGDGATVEGTVRTSSPSNRLTAYPKDLLSAPLDDQASEFTVTPGGPKLPAACIPEARPLSAGADTGSPGFGCGTSQTSPAYGGAATLTGGQTPAAAVPGGVGSEISDLLKTHDVTPLVLLVSLLAAMALGGFHALTPGHGKTVLAAYLVGTRGTARHAIALGLSVTVSHTIGVAVLAILIILAGNVIPPDQYQHLVAILSGLMIIAIGAWLLAGRLGTWGSALSVATAMSREQDDEHDHPLDHDHEHQLAQAHDHDHDGRGHSHVPPPGRELTWRTLFALGLSGGIVPSSSALIILLATLTTGRAAYGLVLVIAFGLGMAIVLTAVGLALVYARAYVERLPRRQLLQRVAMAVPLVTAMLVLGIGILLTGSALAGQSLTG
jgi:nickel/cobalt transporter (NicO) family protein